MHHQFGTIVGTEALGGMLDPDGAVITDGIEIVTLAEVAEVDGVKIDGLGLKLSGVITRNGEQTNDTFAAVFILSALEAGTVVGTINKAIQDCPSPSTSVMYYAALEHEVGK